MTRYDRLLPLHAGAATLHEFLDFALVHHTSVPRGGHGERAVGGGDSFASGFIYGLMTTGDAQKAVEYGAAHGALAMTTPGDTSMVDKGEVEKLMKGGGARVQR